jgi:hypothetical protein
MTSTPGDQQEIRKKEHDLFMELIAAATTMSVMAKKSADIMGEPHDAMLMDPAHHLDAILERCPTPNFIWDGTLHDEHMEVEAIHGPNQLDTEKKKGARVRHRFLRGGVEYTQKDSFEENVARARNLLEERLRKKYPVGT